MPKSQDERNAADAAERYPPIALLALGARRPVKMREEREHDCSNDVEVQHLDLHGRIPSSSGGSVLVARTKGSQATAIR